MTFYYHKGYIGKKLNEKLATHDVDLITTVRKNMKARAMSVFDRAMFEEIHY
jgi:hypothetical protein